MIEEMLKKCAELNCTPSEIKDMVKEALLPYFEHNEALDKYACSSEILSVFEFFIRYYQDDKFKKGIHIILNYYKEARNKNKAQTWEIILSTYEIMLDVDNKMYNIRKEKIDFTDDDLYDKMMKIFRKIGDTLEISTKQLIRELYALIKISYNKNINYTVIKNQNLGTLVSELLNFDNLTFLFLIEPSNLKLSDWRNIAYHHTYFLDNQNNINCKYGNKNQYNIKISINELEQYAHKIIRTCNILSLARTIFIFDNFDYISDIKNNGKIASISLRQKLKDNSLK